MNEFEALSLGKLRGRIDSQFAKAVAAQLETASGSVQGLLGAATRSKSEAGRAPTFVLDLPGHEERIHLRLARRGGWLGAVLPQRLFGEARGLRELEISARLHAAGAPVVRPVFALGERRGLFHVGIFGSVHREAPNGLEFLRSEVGSERIVAAATAAGRAVRRVHDAGTSHGDLHLGNLLVEGAAAKPSVLIIDLDAARDETLQPATRMSEIMRLYRSILKHDLQDIVGARAGIAFFSAYCGEDRALRRALLEHFGRERRRIAHHGLELRRRFQSRSDLA